MFVALMKFDRPAFELLHLSKVESLTASNAVSVLLPGFDASESESETAPKTSRLSPGQVASRAAGLIRRLETVLVSGSDRWFNPPLCHQRTYSVHA